MTKIDEAVMARLKAPFGCELFAPNGRWPGRWRIHDANDDAIASVAFQEEGYARLIVQALNEFFHREIETRLAYDELRKQNGLPSKVK
jgi:hypothetical protein